jgi:hypothetical protein
MAHSGVSGNVDLCEALARESWDCAKKETATRLCLYTASPVGGNYRYAKNKWDGAHFAQIENSRQLTVIIEPAHAPRPRFGFALSRWYAHDINAGQT